MKMKPKPTGSKEMDAACAAKCQRKGIGLLALRLIFVFFMLHGISKLGNLDGTAKFFGSLGIPAATPMAWFIALLETFGSLAVILGVFTEYLAPLIAIDMLVAIVLTRLPQVMAAGLPLGIGKAELESVYLLAALAVWLAGPGKYSLKHYLGWGCPKKC